jgi:hypothetical protein
MMNYIKLRGVGMRRRRGPWLAELSGPPNCCQACGITSQFRRDSTSLIPAQRNRAPPCQIAADAAFLERLKIRLKVL